MAHEGRYGAQPYETVVKAEFELKGLESPRHAAHLQYKLMLLDTVLRVHIDYAKRSMSLEYTDPARTERILDEIKPVKAILKSRGLAEYDKIVAGSYHDL